jgi:hypothetical protein
MLSAMADSAKGSVDGLTDLPTSLPAVLPQRLIGICFLLREGQS